MIAELSTMGYPIYKLHTPLLCCRWWNPHLPCFWYQAGTSRFVGI